MNRRTRTTLLGITALLFMIACMPVLAPTPAPLPTFDINAPLTAIVETAHAAATQTALMAPPTTTPTLPTNTPLPSPTPSPTFIFVLATATSSEPTKIPLGSSQKQYDCQVISVDPKEQMAPNQAFAAKWIVANIGKSLWNENDLDYRYTSGEKMYMQSAYDFPASVIPGATVLLEAAMKAPANPGTYTTIWQIQRSKSDICKLELTVTVK